MYKFTYVKPESGDPPNCGAWYLDGELLVDGYDVRAVDLLCAIQHVFPHLLETIYISDEEIPFKWMPESLDEFRGIGSELEEGAWKEFKGCIER